MNKNIAVTVDIEEVKPARIQLDHKDLVLIQAYRRSNEEDNYSLDDQQEHVEHCMHDLNIPIYPAFLIKDSQHTTEGYIRQDFIKMKNYWETGINGKKANGLIGYRLERLFGRDEEGEYQIFGKSLERYMRDNNLVLFEMRRRINLFDHRDLMDIGYRKAQAKGRALETLNDTKRGIFRCAMSGRPINKAPWLWHWEEEKTKINGRTEREIFYWLIEERVRIFWKVKQLYKTGKYGYAEIADKLNREGYTWIDVQNRKPKKHILNYSLVRELLTRKVFYTGKWDDRAEFENPDTGERRRPKVTLPMKYKGKAISDGLKEWKEIQTIIKENACYNGTDVYTWILTGHVRCDNCGERLRSNPQVPKDRKKKIHCYYRCPKCGMLVPKKPFENSVINVMDSIFKEPEEIKKLLKKDRAWERETDARLKELKSIIKIVDKEKKDIENNMIRNFKQRDFNLNKKLVEQVNKRYEELPIIKEQAEAEINKLETEKKCRTDLFDPSRNKILALAIRFRNAFGLKNRSLDFTRNFIGTLYPKGSQEYCIKVSKENGTFYWKATGILNNSDFEGMFKSMTEKALGKLEKEMPFRSPCSRVIQGVLGREPTNEEVKSLKKHGLINKSEWYKQDIVCLRDVLKSNDDKLTFHG